MKRILTVILVMNLVFTVCGCSSGPELVTDVEFDWDSAEALSFQQLLMEASEAHKQESQDRAALDGFENYLAADEDFGSLLTEEEVELLKEERQPNREHISTNEFKDDISLLFRALKSSYGPYFYLGGEDVFGKMEEKLHKIVMDYDPDVPGDELINEFNKQLTFIQDRNFGVEGVDALTSNNMIYEYYYCNLYFSKDENGFYTMAGGQKWYYDSCRNEGVAIQPVLTAEGELKYSPVLLSMPFRVRTDDKMTLLCEDKKAEVLFGWVKGEPFGQGGSGENFDFIETDGTVYIRMNSFSSQLSQEAFRQFEETGRKAKDSKLVIYDLRGCQGSEGEPARKWAANFTGDETQLNGCRAVRKSVLAGGDGTFEYVRTEGTFSENGIPVIILVDSCTSGAGELAMLYGRTIENAIIIGSNTAGNQLSGEVIDISLPNSGVSLSIPSSLSLWNSTDNVDGIGYEPDIWCSPDTVMETLAILLEQEGCIQAETFEKLDPRNRMIEEALQQTGSSEMMVLYDKWLIGENDPFGGENFDDDLVFLVDGAPISDYRIFFDNPNVAKVTYNDDGSVRITLKTPGNWPFRVDYNGESYYFILAV